MRKQYAVLKNTALKAWEDMMFLKQPDMHCTCPPLTEDNDLGTLLENDANFVQALSDWLKQNLRLGLQCVKFRF